MTRRTSHRQWSKKVRYHDNGVPCKFWENRKKEYRERINPITTYTRVDEFQKRFRLTPEMVQELSRQFGSSSACSSEGTGKGGGISFEEKVCLGLRYMATGANYEVIKDTQGVSRETVKRSVDQFVKFLYTRRTDHIRFPKGIEMYKTAARFDKRFGFKQVVGCVDGTYIPIKRPSRNEQAYICRHEFHALNCLVVSDADQRFLFVEPAMSGINHDMAVWEESDLGAKISSTNRLGNFFLLGDSGFALTKNLLTPYKQRDIEGLQPWQKRYQAKQTSTRSSVERAIGQLKTRWRCLSKHGSGVIKKEPVQAGWLFVACCVLHNMCLDWGIGALSPQNNADPDIEARIMVDSLNDYLKDVKHIDSSQAPRHEKPTSTKRSYEQGLKRRAQVMHQQFGGPNPEENSRRRCASGGTRGVRGGRVGRRGRGRRI